ncbi:hypothetical protein BDD43_5166 [Mucilaginibacter gracilis]|uniref:K1 capsule-specific polysaccharide lyase C-terminal domain-containing protein n=1 Tax=Mucilaginibacter gracilis TaxID=423350 RepID=A0A495J828_9SPHI|nr:hypothetical protein [Mucilaginibacter gracilis]RKR84913.1 hypothetical protein BDD43_5166 [Mucilaginibacter gracilis]
MAANLEIGGAVKRTQKGDADWYYGGDNEAWASLAAAKAGVPAAVRPGKTVGVFVSGSVVEYWWPTSAVSDADLVIKVPPVVTDASPVNGSSNPVQSGGVYTALNNKQDSLGYTAENTANKNVANGYAGLDGSGKVSSAQLPSYVDDVLEFANLAALPTTGETGKIYVTLDTNFEYRWSGSAYIRLVSSPGTTDALAEGVTNLYYTAARVKAYADTLYASLTGSYTDPAWINSLAASKLTGDTLPANVIHSILTTLGTIITGVWNATVIDPQYGGTGLAAYTIGDLLYASGPTTLSKLLAVATGNVLLSGGAGTAPTYGKVGLTTHVTGILPITNGGTGTSSTFTPGSLIFAGPSGVYTQDNANLFYDATNHRIGFSTTAPTHQLTLGSTSTGIAYYNTTDQTTNYERVRHYWSGGVYNITYENGGTGSTGRTIALGFLGSTQLLIKNNGGDVTGTVTVARLVNAGAMFGVGGGQQISNTTSTPVSGYGISILPTIVNTLANGYSALYISPFESSIGTGGNYLINAGTNTGASASGTHSSVFTVDRVGNTLVSGNLTVTPIASAGGLVTTTSSGQLGSLPSVAAGSVLVSNGIGALPIYTASPTFFQWFRGGNVSSANRGTSGYGIDSAYSTFLDNSTVVNGTVSNYSVVAFAGGAFSATNTGVTASNLATVYIASAPTAGTNVTASNTYALQIASGNSIFGGNTYFSGNIGIGTTTPNTSLEVLIAGAGGGVAATNVSGIRATRTTTNQSQYIQMDLTDGSFARLYSQGAGKGLAFVNVSGNAAGNNTQDGIVFYTPSSSAGVANTVPTLVINSGRPFVGIGLPLSNSFASSFLTLGGSTVSMPAWGLNGIQLQAVASTFNNSSTAASTVIAGITAINSFAASTITSTNTGVSYNGIATVYIDNAPIAGTNVSITNNYALYSASGANFFNGATTFAGGGTLTSSTLLQSYISIFPTISQTGTAGFRGLYLSAYITSQGSGNSQSLIDIGTNTAANGAGTHNSKFSVNYSGDTNIGGQLAVPGGSIITSVPFTAGNFYVTGFNAASQPSTQATWLFGGATSVQLRVNLGGTTISSLTANNNYTNTLIANTGYNTASTGTHAFANSLTVLPVTLGTNNGASVTNTASLYIDNAGTGGTNNYALYSAAGTNYFGGNTIFNSPIWGTGLSSGSSAFLVTGGATIVNTASDAKVQLGGSTNMMWRVLLNASSAASLSSGLSYANLVVGSSPVALSASGTSPVIANVAINPIGTVTTGGGTATVGATLYLGGAGTGAVDNYALYSKSGANYFGGNLLIGTTSDNITDKVQVSGNVNLLTPGNKIKIATGTNASIGTSTLVAGTITINTTAVSASSIIMICRKANGGTIGGLTYGTIVAGTSFVISSDSSADTSQVNWWILN